MKGSSSSSSSWSSCTNTSHFTAKDEKREREKIAIGDGRREMEGMKEELEEEEDEEEEEEMEREEEDEKQEEEKWQNDNQYNDELPKKTSRHEEEEQELVMMKEEEEKEEEEDKRRGTLDIPGKFLLLDQILNILKRCEKGFFSVPSGVKNDVYFVLEDAQNTSRKNVRLRPEYPDDCGVWDGQKGKTVNSFVVLSPEGIVKTVVLKEGVFCVESRKGGALSWLPLDPQPEGHAMVKVHRYYSTLKGDDGYRRRVTRVHGGDFEGKTLVEYAGVRSSGITSHGNSKSAREYRRTDPRLLRKMNEEVKSKSTKEVYEEMARDGDLGAPRSLKQVADAKYRATKKNLQESVLKVAAERLDLLTLLETKKDVQTVVYRKEKPACIVLHSEEQVAEMKANLERDCVLGIDCSYQVGECYLTFVIYRNSRAALNKSTKPLYLGLTFLHWDVEARTYTSFFSHLAGVLGDTQPAFEVKMRKETDSSLFHALEECFPSSVVMLSSENLKENVQKQLCGDPDQKTHESVILDKIFGTDGILNSSCKGDFEGRVSQLLGCIESQAFGSYFSELQPFLYPYVCEGRQKGAREVVWKDSDGEMLSAVLRLTLQDRPHKLADLIEKICITGRLQMLNLQNVT